MTSGKRWTDHGLEPSDLPHGIEVPAFLNAHVHFEVGPLPRPTQRGFLPWLDQVQRTGSTFLGKDAEQFLTPAADRFRTSAASGTGRWLDVSNTGLTGSLFGPRGVCLHEKLGIDIPTHTTEPGTRPIPHAVYSTHPAWIQQCAALPGVWSIHVDEDPAESAFLRGEGPWPERLRAFGRNLDGFEYPMLSPIAYLEALGVLSPRALLVHCVETGPGDLDRIAASGASVCICARSNLWIGGRLPDVPGMLDRGIPIRLGTDSLASSPDLDLLDEIVTLRRAFPEVDPGVWLRAATSAFAGLEPVERFWFPDVGTVDELLDGTRWPRSLIGEGT